MMCMKRRTQWVFAAIAACLIQSTSFAARVGTTIKSDKGYDYRWQWQTEIGLGGFGVLYNMLSLCMMLTLDENKKLSFFTLNVAINIIDMFFALGRVIFPSIYLYYHRTYGGLGACRFEAMWDITMITWSLLAIVGISLVAKYDLCNGTKFSENQMRVYMGICLIYSVALSIFCVFFPYGSGVQVDSSGSYCFIVWASHVGVPAFYFFALIIPITFLVYNLRLIYIKISNAQAVLKAHGIAEQAKGPFVQMVMKLGYFSLTSSLGYLPVMSISFYEWTTNRYYPAIWSGFAGLCAVSLSSLVNPSLFFYLNPDLRDQFYELIGKHIIKCFKALGLIYLYKRIVGSKKRARLRSRRRKLSILAAANISKNPELASALKLASLSAPKLQRNFFPIFNISTLFQTKTHPLNNAPEPNKQSHGSSVEEEYGHTGVDYQDMNDWLTDPILSKHFQAHGRKQHALENLLFYDEARSYLEESSQFFSALKSFFEDNDAVQIFDDNKEPHQRNDRADAQGKLESLNSDWKELEAMGVRICKLYIKAPTAPLEINISCDIRNEILRHVENHSWAGDMQYPPLLSLINTSEVDKSIAAIALYVNLFNVCAHNVHRILRTDLWPRFKDTDRFHDAVMEHQIAHSTGFQQRNLV